MTDQVGEQFDKDEAVQVREPEDTVDPPQMAGGKQFNGTIDDPITLYYNVQRIVEYGNDVVIEKLDALKQQITDLETRIFNREPGSQSIVDELRYAVESVIVPAIQGGTPEAGNAKLAGQKK